MKITVFQALTLLADKYKNNIDNQDIYLNVMSIYLSGIKNKNDQEVLDDLLKDDALKSYIISEDKEDINEDPVRRYFESHLSYETLCHSLDDLDLFKLNDHFESIFNKMDQQARDFLIEFMYSGKETKGQDFSNMEKEYAENIKMLMNEKTHAHFKPINGRKIKIAEYLLTERKQKMVILLKCIDSAIMLLNVNNEEEFPIDIYDSFDSDSVFFPDNRGKEMKIDPKIQKCQKIHSQALGIMKSYMPLGKNDALYSPEPARYIRPADMSTYMKGMHEMPERIFSTKVTPFVNSISGTMLAQLRVIANLRRNNSFMYEKESDVEQLKFLFKTLIACLIYHSGGHSIYEFMSVFLLPEVQKEFESLKGFSSLTMENLFKDENAEAFEAAIDKTIQYNTVILNRQRVRETIEARREPEVLTENEEELLEMSTESSSDAEKPESNGDISQKIYTLKQQKNSFFMKPLKTLTCFSDKADANGIMQNESLPFNHKEIFYLVTGVFGGCLLSAGVGGMTTFLPAVAVLVLAIGAVLLGYSFLKKNGFFDQKSDDFYTEIAMDWPSHAYDRETP